MTMERPQATTEAGKTAPAGSDKAQAKQDRIAEFIASLNPAEVAEFRKVTLELHEPDFQAKDKLHQRRQAALEKDLKAAKEAMLELADAETLSRYQAEKGSLEKAKERAVKNGLPSYMARHAHTFDDLWEAEDDHRKGAGATGTETNPDEDATFMERLKRVGVQVPERSTGTAGTFKQTAPGSGGGLPGPTPMPTKFDPRGGHVKSLRKAVAERQ